MSNDDLVNLAQMRKDMFLTAYSYPNGVAHLASAFSIAEILYTLYIKKIAHVDPLQPLRPERDRVILSKGHGGLALYSALCMAGFFPREELFTFCRPNSRLGGEPRMHELPGVEASTGALGHGLSFGVGVALSNKLDERTAKVYVIIGDGESQEGSIWEASMSAPRHGLDNLTVILDYNRMQKMAFVDEIMAINAWQDKWTAFGWQVELAHGHDINSLEEAFARPHRKNTPKIIIADTIKGKGVSIIENNVDWHYKMPNKREMKIVMQELGITQEELVTCREHS